MSALPQVFNFNEMAVRMEVRDGEPWFIAKDICAVLDIKQASVALERLDADEKGVTTIHTPGGLQEVGAVNEAGMFTLVLSSRKPEAKAFKRFVTHEVLPQIHKMGAYIHPSSPLGAAEAMLATASKLLEAQKLMEARLTAVETALASGPLTVQFREHDDTLSGQRAKAADRQRRFRARQRGDALELPPGSGRSALLQPSWFIKQCMVRSMESVGCANAYGRYLAEAQRLRMRYLSRNAFDADMEGYHRIQRVLVKSRWVYIGYELRKTERKR